VTCNKKFEISDWSSAFGLFGKTRGRKFQRYVQKGKRRSGRYSNPVSRQQMRQNGSQEKHMGICGVLQTLEIFAIAE
jgi:hypothetical protein